MTNTANRLSCYFRHLLRTVGIHRRGDDVLEHYQTLAILEDYGPERGISHPGVTKLTRAERAWLARREAQATGPTQAPATEPCAGRATEAASAEPGPTKEEN